MPQLTTDEKLTLDAFYTTVTICQERGISLPNEIMAVVADLEHHSGELDAIAERNADFDAIYQAEKLSAGTGERSKLIRATDGQNTADGSSPNRHQTNGGSGQVAARSETTMPSPPEVSSQTADTPTSASLKSAHPAALPLPPLPFAKEKILKTLERSHLTVQELIYTINQPPQQTQEILHTLWQKGYIDELATPLPYILFPGLRSAQYRNHFPAMDTILALTTKGYFHLYPLVTRNKRMVSA
jgi:hypothetical protein